MRITKFKFTEFFMSLCNPLDILQHPVWLLLTISMVNFITYNVNGLNKQHKRIAIFNFLKETLKTGIYILQETHSTPADVQNDTLTGVIKIYSLIMACLTLVVLQYFFII